MSRFSVDTEFAKGGMTSKTYDISSTIFGLLASFALGIAIWIFTRNLVGAMFAASALLITLISLHQVAKMIVYGIRETKYFSGEKK